MDRFFILAVLDFPTVPRFGIYNGFLTLMVESDFIHIEEKAPWILQVDANANTEILGLKLMVMAFGFLTEC